MTSINELQQTIGTEFGANFMAGQVRNALKLAITRQAADDQRVAWFTAGAKLTKHLRKMNSLRLARRFERTFGYTGVFNPWAVTADERFELQRSLWAREMGRLFGDYVPALSAVIELSAFDSILGVEPAITNTGRLTAAQVEEIRTIRAIEGTSYRKLAAWLATTHGIKVSGDMIRSICIGECYANVATHVIEFAGVEYVS